LAGGYSSSSFSLGFLLELARRKSDNSTIKKYSKYKNIKTEESP
jgi:hypothetical protein